MQFEIVEEEEEDSAQLEEIVETLETEVCVDTRFIFERAFSYDITAAILVFQNKETAAIFIWCAKPFQREKLCFCSKAVFCFSKPIWPLVR